MKSIADFVISKIRRAEVVELLHFEAGGAAHDTLGACEGTLQGPNGNAILYEQGLILGSSTIPYAEIEEVTTPLTIGRVGGETIRVEVSPAGGEVLFATLRWIGNTRLRRKIAT